MPRRKTIDDEVDETYEDYDSQSSENFSDLVEDEDSAQSKHASRKEETQSGPKKRGRKPKNESGVKTTTTSTTKSKKAPTGRPRGRPRKNPIVPVKSELPSSPTTDNQFDSLLSLGQAALLALNTVSDIKTEDDNSSVTPLSPATPLYPLKKRFLATMTPSQGEPTKENSAVEKVEKVEKEVKPITTQQQQPAQPVKRRPGRPRKDQQPVQPIPQEVKESQRDESDAKKMTSRQQILYLKKLEEKRDSDSEGSSNEKDEEEKSTYQKDEISLDFDSDESEEEEKKKPKRKVLKKKAHSSPWMKVDKITAKHKGKLIGTFDVSLFGSDSSFNLDISSTVDIGKLSLEKAKDIDYSSFYIISFSSRNKSDEEKLEELYNTLERDDCVGSASFDDRALLFIPKKSRFTKPLGLYEIQDEPTKFIGGLFIKEVPSSPERISKKKSKSSSAVSTPKSPILFTTGMDEDMKRNQLSLMSIPKIPKNKLPSATTSGDHTPVEDVKLEQVLPPISTPPSSNFTTSHINTPVSYQTHDRNAYSNVRVQPSTISNPVYSSNSMYSNNMPKNTEINTGLNVTQNGHYDKPIETPTYPQMSTRYTQEGSTGYSSHGMQDQYHSSSYSVHMQQNAPNHSSMDMRSHYDNSYEDLKRKRMQAGYNEPTNRPVSPKRRKSDVPYHQVHTQYSYQHEQQQHSIPSTTSSQPMDMYRSYPTKPQPPPTSSSSVQPPPPPPNSPPPVVSNSTTHSYTSGSRYNNQSGPYTHNQYQQPIPPPRRTDTNSNYGYSSKPSFASPSKSYYKNDGDYDNYDRSRGSYKKYDDGRYQGNNGSGMNYSRRTDYVQSYDNNSNDYFNNRKPYYENTRRYDSGPTSSNNVPPPPPPPETPKSEVILGSDNRASTNDDDYNDMNFDEAAEPTRHLWVGRFHNMKMDYSTIYSDFEKFGQIDSLNLLRDQKCAFVNFALVKDAVRAKKELEGSKKYRKIAYQRREKKTGFTSDYKKVGMAPYHKNDHGGYHNNESYRHIDNQ